MAKFLTNIPSPDTIDVTEDGKERSIVLIGKDELDEKKEKRFEFVLEENGRMPDDYLLTALELSGGNITRAAKLIDIDRSLYYKRCESVDGFQEKMLEIRERKLDFAEDKLWEHVEYGNLPAIMFYLRTIGKNRGYTTQVEMVGNKDKPVEINFTFNNIGDTEDDYS